MSDIWIDDSKELLKRMKELSSKDKRDRLEIVNSMLFTLGILERSLLGWRSWVKDLSIMSQFTLEELAEMEIALGKQIQSFVEYDIEASKRWLDKPSRVLPKRMQVEEESRRGMYV